MAKKIINAILSWLKSTEMFARPSKQIPGKWELVEYYIEKGNDLLNFKKGQLKENSESWKIEFTAENKFFHQCNLPVWQINKVTNGFWSISKNFITIISSEIDGNNIEFQFAVEKEKLKLLKKDALGRIEFFGFLSKIN